MIVDTIVYQHAEEAAFLWSTRDNAVLRPHYSLKDLARLDNRVEAHLDGLRVAGDAGWDICKEVTSICEAGELFTAAVIAFERGDEACIRAVLKAAYCKPESFRGIVSALGWIPFAQADVHIRKLLTADSSSLRSIGIAASAVHRREPGRPLIDAITDSDPLLRASALKAVGQLGRIDLLSLLLFNRSSEDELCRYNAAWSAVLLGDTSSIVTLKSVTGSDRSWREEALKIALRRMDLPSALEWQLELSGSPDSVRSAVIASGVIGDPVLIPWLIGRMTVPGLARVAGEAFTMITGVDVAYEDLEGEGPDGFAAGPTENPEDEDVEMDHDADLPWPDPGLILGWWGRNKGCYKNGTRYLSGQPITSANLLHVLRTGRQRQRHAAALELAMMSPGQPLFEVRATGWRQKQLLGLE